MEYSITVTNKFSLALDEDEDPLEVLKVREQEKEAKKREKQSEKENKVKNPDAQKTAVAKTQKSRVIKEVAQTQAPKTTENKKDQAEKKPPQARTTGERNVKFSAESREEHFNRRNREDRDKPFRPQQNDSRRGPQGEGRNNFRGTEGTRDFGEKRERGDRGDRAERAERGDRPERGERGDRGDRSERMDRGDRPDRGERGDRGARRGMGDRPRGGSRGRGDNRGKREFDRQSGSDKTGIKPVDKKDGAGSHNWGTHNDEIEESLNQENQDWNVEKSDGEAAPTATEPKEGEAPADSAEEKPAEEEARELTLDEWKALQGQRAKPQYNLRKAGEGEDLSRWKKMYALEKKKEEIEEEEEEEEEYDATAEYPQRVGRQKHVLGIEIQFSDNRRRPGNRNNNAGRSGRTDRSNGGGGRGFGGNRGPTRDAEPRGPNLAQPEQRSPRGRQNAPKVDDEHDFPSLA